MSTNVGAADVRNFFIQNYNTDKISLDDAKDLGIDPEQYKFADTNDDNCFDLDEIGNIPDLLAAFTAAVAKDQEAQTRDADQEKEEKNKVQETGQAKH